MSVVLENTYLISDLRKDVLMKLVDLGKLPPGSLASRVRLREKWNTRAGGVLRDGLSLKQHNISLVEGREITVQVSEFITRIPFFSLISNLLYFL